MSGQSDVSIETRVAALEQQVQALEQQIQQLLTGSAVSRAQSSSSRRLRERTIGSLPTHLISVWAFAELHRIPEQKVQAHIDISLLPVHRGTWTDHDGQAVSVTFDAKGRQAFHLLYHEIPWFVPCSQCPHALPEHI